VILSRMAGQAPAVPRIMVRTGTIEYLYPTGRGSIAGRRLIAVIAMLVGALVGALLVVHAHVVYPLVVALIVLVAIGVMTRRAGASDPTWVRDQSV
jgi:hypothetical protein